MQPVGARAGLGRGGKVIPNSGPAPCPSLPRYLYKSSSPGVQDYLCNRLYTLPEREVEKYLSQLTQLCMIRPNSSLERVIIDLCSRSLRIAIKVSVARRCHGRRRHGVRCPGLCFSAAACVFLVDECRYNTSTTPLLSIATMPTHADVLAAAGHLPGQSARPACHRAAGSMRAGGPGGDVGECEGR